jgi:polyhydroxyalkanoate synthesis regulator phasin
MDYTEQFTQLFEIVKRQDRRMDELDERIDRLERRLNEHSNVLTMPVREWPANMVEAHEQV